MFKHNVNVETPEKIVVEHRATVLIAPSNFTAAEKLIKTVGKMTVAVIGAKTVHDVAVHIAKTAVK